jgi:hypothetical protein
MTQLENHMVLPHPTPSEWEGDAPEITTELLYEAWDNFSELNRSDMDYLSNVKRYQVALFDPLTPFLKESIQKRVETFNDLFDNSESFEFDGMDLDLRTFVYQWWVSL